MILQSLRNPYVVNSLLVLSRSLNGVWLVMPSLKLLFSLKAIAITKTRSSKHQEIFQSLDLLLHGMVVVPCYIYHISDGYDVVKIFYNKFTHISPCWFQIRRYRCLFISHLGTLLDLSMLQEIKMWIRIGFKVSNPNAWITVLSSFLGMYGKQKSSNGM